MIALQLVLLLYSVSLCGGFLHSNSALMKARNSYSFITTPARSSSSSTFIASTSTNKNPDVIVIGSGMGGLCAANILRHVHKKTVLVLESHYLPGGCAHTFPIKGYEFESGPTILLGCSKPPLNPLRQVLDICGLNVDWISYSSWGVLGDGDEQWDLELGRDASNRPKFDSIIEERSHSPSLAKTEFAQLLEKTLPLIVPATEIPAMALRADSKVLFTLLAKHTKSLFKLLQLPDAGTGPFDPYMNGPIHTVTDPWLRSWLDGLAFSLSGLEAARTPASAMSYVLWDLHRDNGSLDYPKGGMKSLVNALVSGLGDDEIRLKSTVASIDIVGNRACGVTLKNGEKLESNEGVICNAPLWCLRDLLKPAESDSGNGGVKTLLDEIRSVNMTRSYLHLHVGLDAEGIDQSKLKPHYTVWEKGMVGDSEHVCSELNMIAVSNVCNFDDSLEVPEGKIMMHAYACGNEEYGIWEDLSKEEYEALKKERAETLWSAIEKVVPDARERCEVEMIGSPLTHERFLRRPRGTYGAEVESLFQDGSTPIDGLVLCGDGIFPGIGLPSVALSGVSAANSFVGVWKQLQNY